MLLLEDLSLSAWVLGPHPKVYVPSLDAGPLLTPRAHTGASSLLAEGPGGQGQLLASLLPNEVFVSQEFIRKPVNPEGGKETWSHGGWQLVTYV